MHFKQPRAKPEKEGAIRLIDFMRAQGWYCRRLNVSAGTFSTVGFPDYFCTYHRVPQIVHLYNARIKNLHEAKSYIRDPELFELGMQRIPGYSMIMAPFRWIETKTKEGSLEPSQAELYGKWIGHNVGTWVLHDEKDYPLLFQFPNFSSLCLRGKIR